MPPLPPLDRRQFIQNTAAASLALAAVPQLGCASPGAAPATNQPFESQWHLLPDRVWLGEEFWANSLQDWRVAGGRVECVRAAPARNIHLLTRDLIPAAGTVSLRLTLGLTDHPSVKAGKGGAGFLLGVRGPLNEFRNNLMQMGSGLRVGLRTSGEIFIGDGPNGTKAPADLSGGSVELRFEAEPSGAAYRAKLTALDPKDGKVLGTVSRDGLPGDFLHGNIALAANYGSSQGAAAKKAANNAASPGVDRWWFSNFAVSGTKVASHPARSFGPVFFTSYTVHAGILKLTAQMPPLGQDEQAPVRLQIAEGGAWKTIAESAIHPLARTAGFRVANWDASRDVRYRVACALRTSDGQSAEHFFEGLIRRDPVDQEELNVADISCNAHYAFPNTACAESVLRLNPDLVAFTGDQYYESTGNLGVDGSTLENSCLDVLRKWLIHGWTWRELTRDRPSLSLPDDHDVYHGNLWGESGAAAPARSPAGESKGGYKYFAEFVNAVHIMQTSHHPDSPAKPGKQGITGYYGPLTYGRVSFAILADRQYKSGPDGKVPPTTSGRADHVNDPAFDPKTADLPGLELLGAPQMEFLRNWATDWRGADMKAAISQTLFTAMATHHGSRKGFLVADYDTNAWPQAARNAAVRELRRAFAFHLAGDQHLPAVVHYGVDGHRDGCVGFASPAVNNLYPRYFYPTDGKGPLGDFRDSFGHPLTVLACANPQDSFRSGVLEAETDKNSGFGVVRFNKKHRTIRVECWPLLADPLKPGTQFPGWPVTVSQTENYARKTAGFLPEVEVSSEGRAVVAVMEEKSGETLYSLRLNGSSFKPFVFADGPHTLRVSLPETGASKEFKGLTPNAASAVLKVAL